MSDKVLLSVGLTLVVLGALFVYAINDQLRATGGTGRLRNEQVLLGTKIYAQYCAPCHGPKGEGCVGPALDRVSWKANNPETDTKAVTEFLHKVLERGRAANQPGIQMPAWALEEGGPLNSQQIEDLIVFIMNGNWEQPLQFVPSANLALEAKDLPNPQSDPNEKDTKEKPAARQYSAQEMEQIRGILLTRGCLNCHSIGSGVGGNVAISLNDVGSRRENLARGIRAEDWIKRWINNPRDVPEDQRGHNLFVNPSNYPTADAFRTALLPYNEPYMPRIPMPENELNLISRYLASLRIVERR